MTLGEQGCAIRIGLVDGHTMFREGLRRLLEVEPGFEVVGEASNGEEAAILAKQLKPNIMLLELALPNSSGLDALAALQAGTFTTRCLLLVAAITTEEIIKSLQLGAYGWVMKAAQVKLLFRSIRAVMAGQYWIGRENVSDLVHALCQKTPAGNGDSAKPRFGLTPRELQILARIVSGYSNKEIAKDFTLSERTIKHHLTNTFDKVGVSSRLELALFAINHRLTEET